MSVPTVDSLMSDKQVYFALVELSGCAYTYSMYNKIAAAELAVPGIAQSQLGRLMEQMQSLPLPNTQSQISFIIACETVHYTS